MKKVKVQFHEEKKHSLVYSSKDFPGIYIPKKFFPNAAHPPSCLYIRFDTETDLTGEEARTYVGE